MCIRPIPNCLALILELHGNITKENTFCVIARSLLYLLKTPSLDLNFPRTWCH